MNLAGYVAAQREWSEKTFGPGERSGVIDHIKKEIKEVEQSTSPEERLKEFIDIAILALDGAWRTGATPEEVERALLDKQCVNIYERTWPDWRTIPENMAIEHVRDK